MEVAISTDFYQCSCCFLNFATEFQYKKHYQTKFHQYNLKRKLIDLPPSSEEQYEARFNQFSKSNEQKKQESYKAAKNYCDTCNKGFGNENTFETHLKSKKHLETFNKKQAHKQSNPVKSEQQPKTEQKTTLDDISICMICDKKTKDFEENLIHMQGKHGFFFAEGEYVNDKEGLVRYLAEKINVGLMCIQCNNVGTKDFKSGEAVKAHMENKCHFFMSTSEFEEYAGFYDFSLKKSKTEEKEEEQINEKKEEEKNESVDANEEQDEDDEEWEDEEDEEEDEDISEEDEEEDDEEKDKSKIKIDKVNKIEQRKLFRRQYKQLNKQRMAKFEYNAAGELELEGGKTLGHRQYEKQYNMYYRLRADPLKGLRGLLGPEISESRQIMLNQKLGQVAMQSQQVRQMAFRQEELNQHRFIHKKKQLYVKLGVKGNKVVRHHYRNANPL